VLGSFATRLGGTSLAHELFIHRSSFIQSSFIVVHQYYSIPAAPSSAPLNVQISAVSSSGFLVSWSAPPARDHNGNIQSYTINITEENTGGQLQFTSTSNSLRVESRHPYYNYTCRVAAVTVAAGPHSEPTMVTTLEDGK
jgi:hypothetical protein